MTRLGLLLTTALTLLACPCAAETIERQARGTATLEVRFEPKLTLADTITATLVVEARPGWEISRPRDLPTTAKWLLVDRSKEERESLPAGWTRWRQTYRFAPKEPGDLPFTFPDVGLRDPNAGEKAISWNAIPIQVAVPAVSPDRAAIRGNTDVERSPRLPVHQIPWYYVLIWFPLLLPFIALIVLLCFLLRRKQAHSALARALYELQRLTAMNLPTRGRGERFITLLTLLVRAYLERACAWPARRQTTPEFRAACECAAALNADEKRFLIELMQRAEVIKYAHANITIDECMLWAEKTRQFLRARGVGLYVTCETKSD